MEPHLSKSVIFIWKDLLLNGYCQHKSVTRQQYYENKKNVYQYISNKCSHENILVLQPGQNSIIKCVTSSDDPVKINWQLCGYLRHVGMYLNLLEKDCMGLFPTWKIYGTSQSPHLKQKWPELGTFTWASIQYFEKKICLKAQLISRAGHALFFTLLHSWAELFALVLSALFWAFNLALLHSLIFHAPRFFMPFFALLNFLRSNICAPYFRARNFVLVHLYIARTGQPEQDSQNRTGGTE